MTNFEVWGDSHTDEIVGLGCRYALSYLLNFNQEVKLLRNKSTAGTTVDIWMEEYLSQEDKAEVLVVSSGFNEAVAVHPDFRFLEVEEVINFWFKLITEAKSEGVRVIWIPTHNVGRGLTDFPATKNFRHLPKCLGAEVLNWKPDESYLSPDLTHYNYRTSYVLAQKIIEAVKGTPGMIHSAQIEEKPTPEVATSPEPEYSEDSANKSGETE